MMFPDKVFLASKSPRRLELLSFCFENVQQIQSLREEPLWNKKESAEAYLKRCIEVKALGAEEAYEKLLNGSSSTSWSLVVAADTIVVLSGRVFGKPESPVHSVKMLQEMSGKEHRVLTAYSLSLFNGATKKDSFVSVSSTKVKFRKLSLAEISAYVKTGEPLDKSGSYGVQGPAMQFVEKIEGSYQSVMGVPLFAIQKKVSEWASLYNV